jgi:hypothetical protein
MGPDDGHGDSRRRYLADGAAEVRSNRSPFRLHLFPTAPEDLRAPAPATSDYEPEDRAVANEARGVIRGVKPPRVGPNVAEPKVRAFGCTSGDPACMAGSRKGTATLHTREVAGSKPAVPTAWQSAWIARAIHPPSAPEFGVEHFAKLSRTPTPRGTNRPSRIRRCRHALPGPPRPRRSRPSSPRSPGR